MQHLHSPASKQEAQRGYLSYSNQGMSLFKTVKVCESLFLNTDLSQGFLIITLHSLVLLFYFGEKERELEKYLLTLSVPWNIFHMGISSVLCATRRKKLITTGLRLGLFRSCEKVGQISRACNCISGTTNVLSLGMTA